MSESAGLYLRQWILSTPVDDTEVKLVIALQVKRWEPGQKWLATLLLRCFSPTWLSRFFISRVKHDVRHDVTIWENKRYQPLPILSRTDGEIMAYRNYCAQFYPEAEEAGRSVRSLKPASIRTARRTAKLGICPSATGNPVLSCVVEERPPHIRFRST